MWAIPRFEWNARDPWWGIKKWKIDSEQHSIVHIIMMMPFLGGKEMKIVKNVLISHWLCTLKILEAAASVVPLFFVNKWESVIPFCASTGWWHPKISFIQCQVVFNAVWRLTCVSWWGGKNLIAWGWILF